MPVSVAARSKALVCGRSPAETVGSNPTGGHGYLSVVSVFCCQRSLRRADHSTRGVLPTVVRRCVWSRNLVNEEVMAHWGVCCSGHKQTYILKYKSMLISCLSNHATYKRHNRLFVYSVAQESLSILEVSTRKVLRPATPTQVFLGFPVSISKCWDGSQHSKLPLHASHVALQT